MVVTVSLIRNGYEYSELFKERHLPGLSVTTHHMAPSSGLSVTGKAKHG